jgi:hypothetical protein
VYPEKSGIHETHPRLRKVHLKNGDKITWDAIRDYWIQFDLHNLAAPQPSYRWMNQDEARARCLMHYYLLLQDHGVPYRTEDFCTIVSFRIRFILDGGGDWQNTSLT